MNMFSEVIFYLSKVFRKIQFASIRNSHIDPTAVIDSGSNIIDSSFGRYSFCGYFCEIYNSNVGSFCSIANGVKIGGANHPINWVSTSPVFYLTQDSIKIKLSNLEYETMQKKTIIGHDVWIGQDVLVKQGVTIGTGAVIGMGSVVSKDVEPYSIVVGNPAKVIKMRFSNDIIDSLLNSEWWNFDESKLRTLAKHFDNPEKFIKIIHES